MAYCIILQEKLHEEDVVIISAGYTPPIIIGNSVSAYQDQETSLWKKIKNYNLAKSLDRYIDGVTNGQEFIAYIELMHAYQRILITHRNCIEFHFMEEGTATYLRPDNLEFITNGAKQVGFRNKDFSDFSISLIRVLRGSNIRLLSLPYHPQAYTYFENIKFFTFSVDGYPGIIDSKRVLLSPEKLDSSKIRELTNSIDINGEHIWIEESYPWVYGVSDINYINGIQSMSHILKKAGVENVYLKLRPSSKTENSLLYRTLMQCGFTVNIIQNEIIVEAIFLYSNNLKVIGLVSSLLYYSTLWNHKALSFLNLIKDRPDTVFDNLDIYWNKVERV